jgi:hypothetical protein
MKIQTLRERWASGAPQAAAPAQTVRRLLWPVVPVVMALLVLLLRPADDGAGSLPPIEGLHPEVEARGERLVVVVIDSLRRSTLEAHMPRLAALVAQGSAHMLAVQTCSANFTLPCIQTLLEGRQSPFAAGLHNFTGRSAGAVNLPAALAAAGVAPDLVSDHTLGSLYGAFARSDFDVQTLPDDALARDRAAVARARARLDEGARAVLLHVVGTDKVAHYQKPGHPEYIAQFEAVDADVAGLIGSLRRDRDHVIITGDHGHNEDGHHTRDSVALLWGASFDRLLAEVALPPPPQEQAPKPPKALPLKGALEQTDLLYFLSYPFALPLPLAYEGRYFIGDAAPAPGTRLAMQAAAQRRAMGLAEGAPIGDVPRAFEAARATERARRGDSIWQNAPLLWLYGVFCVVALGALFGEPPQLSLRPLGAAFSVSALGLVGVGGAVAVLSAWGAWVGWSLLALAPAGAWLVRRHGATRHAAWVAALAAVALVSGRWAAEWSVYFHSTGAFKYQIVLFYLMMAAGGALVGALAWGGRLRGWAEGGLLFGLMALPSGVYYYQFGSAMLWGLLIGGALCALWPQRLRERWALLKEAPAPTLGLLVLGPLLVAQTAGGWEWHHKAVGWLQALGTPATWGVGAALGAYLVWQGARTGRARAVLGATLAVGALYSAGVGKLEAAPLVASHIAAAFAAAWLRVPSLSAWRAGPDATSARLTWLLFGLGLSCQWLALRGFFIQNIDFTFGLEAFSWLQHERDVFIATFIATIPKYGLPLFMGLLIARLSLGKAQTHSLFTGLLLLGSLKMLLLLLQIIAGMQADGEQRYELAISELVFIFNYLLMVSLAYGPVQALGRLATPKPSGAPA